MTEQESYDDTIDYAVYATMHALGLSVSENMSLAEDINDFLTERCKDVITGSN